MSIVSKDELIDLKRRAERKMEREDNHILALHLREGDYVDIDCYNQFVENDSESVDGVQQWEDRIHRISNQFVENDSESVDGPFEAHIYEAILAGQELIDALDDVDEVIHDDTIQFEQTPGDIIPLEGIYCKHCDAELYAPYEESEVTETLPEADSVGGW